MKNTTNFDVVICGGGLAGLTLARQLRIELPEVSVAVIDRLARPLQEAAFKVGESAVELGTYYFGQVLKLEKYFWERHLRKLGFRFFVGNSHDPIEERSEIGISLFPPVPSYQIDRGRLENDLRQIIEEMGVTMFEGTVVDDILLAKSDEQHTILCRRKDDESNFPLTARWVVDALGRRRFLQTKLGLKRPNGHQASSAWWRYEGRVDVEEMATGINAQRWLSDTIEDRYLSTNHLTNKGYWVWLIPLGSNATSVGIVTDETMYPQNTYGQTYAMALEWLHQHEPILWKYLQGRVPLDFLSIKNYSYTSAQVFSCQRWSCVGESGFFLDPLYSIGSDFIATTNTVTVEMIRREREGMLTEVAASRFNGLVLDILYQIGLGFYRGTYPVLGHPQIFMSKLTWDTALLWAFQFQVYSQGLLRNPPDELFAIGGKYCELNWRVQELFSDWAENAPPRQIHVRGDMTRMRFMQLLHLELGASRMPNQVLEVMQKNLDRLEELAQVLFWQAEQECHPENPILKKRPWINAWRIVLDPHRWSANQLFDTTTIPRPLNHMRNNFTGIFGPQSMQETLIYDLPYRLAHWQKGFFYYRVFPIIVKRAIEGRSAMWLRKFFARDYPSQAGV